MLKSHPKIRMYCYLYSSTFRNTKNVLTIVSKYFKCIVTRATSFIYRATSEYASKICQILISDLFLQCQGWCINVGMLVYFSMLLVIISRRPIGPVREIIKCPLSVRASVRHVFTKAFLSLKLL